MPSLRPVVQVLILAAVAPWLYDRYVALSPILTNTPARFESLRTFDSYEVKYKDRLKNCEDVILEKSLGIAFLSCDPGRDRWNTVMGTFKPVKNGEDHGGLYIYDYSTPNLPDKDRLKHLQVDEADLHPLGIAYDASTSTLYAINHSRHKGSHILILHVDTKTYATTLVARFTHPLLHAPNSIQVLGPHELYVTNDHYITASKASILSKIETFSGAPGGSVVYVNVRFPKSAKVVARVPFANGITSLNETTLAIASSSKSGLYFFDREENHELALNQIIRTPAAVDNLSTDGHGGVLMAGHPFAPALMKTSKGRWKCDENGSQEEREACQCTAPSWVAEWSEEGGLREVYKDNGSEFCSSSTIVRDNSRDVGIISGLYESGILVFKP